MFFLPHSATVQGNPSKEPWSVAKVASSSWVDDSKIYIVICSGADFGSGCTSVWVVKAFAVSRWSRTALSRPHSHQITHRIPSAPAPFLLFTSKAQESTRWMQTKSDHSFLSNFLGFHQIGLGVKSVACHRSSYRRTGQNDSSRFKPAQKPQGINQILTWSLLSEFFFSVTSLSKRLQSFVLTGSRSQLRSFKSILVGTAGIILNVFKLGQDLPLWPDPRNLSLVRPAGCPDSQPYITGHRVGR